LLIDADTAVAVGRGLSLPLWLVLLEAYLARARGMSAYRLPQTMAAVWCAVLVNLTRPLFALFMGAAGRAHAATPFLLIPDNTPLAFLYALLVVTFIQYWFHRLSHKLRPLWVVHAVHHQGEDYNMVLALRESVLTYPLSLLLAVPVAFLGVPPLALASLTAVGKAYSLFLHSAFLGRLGVLGTVMATPSDHRVHHGSNPRYIDKNFGTFLNLWDRVFGTYEAESEAPVFGTTVPFRGVSAVAANLQPLKAPAGPVPPPPDASRLVGTELKAYVVANVMLVFFLSMLVAEGPGRQLAFAALVALWAMPSMRVLDRIVATGRLAWPWEALRLGALAVALVALNRMDEVPRGVAVAGAIAAAGLVAWAFRSARRDTGLVAEPLVMAEPAAVEAQVPPATLSRR
jgi:sterol desaturase/sphingolipid hydroxylase (fatty acid hydroxylase superfamily)